MTPARLCRLSRNQRAALTELGKPGRHAWLVLRRDPHSTHYRSDGARVGDREHGLLKLPSATVSSLRRHGLIEPARITPGLDRLRETPHGDHFELRGPPYRLSHAGHELLAGHTSPWPAR